ncbi:MAG: patatin family protein [Clostridia bacterium]|nr:patatin family protein [Clostridia bacterium]
MNNGRALILEGGGSRGLYTAGVLDAFLDYNIEFDNCYSVSAGATFGQNFITKQRGRTYNISMKYMNDWRYCSKRSLLLTGDMVGVKFVYDTLPNKLEPADYEAFRNNPCKFYTVCANVETGEVEYLHVEDLKRDMDMVRASASLPIISRMVHINGKKYLDGGILDSIPAKYSLEHGNSKAVVILTQHKGFVKKPSSEVTYIKKLYGRKYPKFAEAAATRHIKYNEALAYIEEHEKLGDVFVFRPKQPVEVARMELDHDKLDKLYHDGYNDAVERMEELKKFLAE